MCQPDKHGTKDGFFWQVMRKRVKYRGPVAATRGMALEALDDAIDALDSGVEPIVAQPVVENDRTRAITIPPAQLLRLVRDEEPITYPEDVERPKTRGDCGDMPRPCPFISCAHHLYLDVNPESGAIKLNFPHLEVWQMAATCSLDVADAGGVTLEEVGRLYNLTRERIRQYEVRALSQIKNADRGDLGIPSDPETFVGAKGPHPGSQ